MARVFRRNGAYWIDYFDENGKRHRKSTGATVKRVAQEILDQVRTEVARREHLGFTDGKTSFPAYARAWIAGRLGKVAPTTHVAYSTAIERHLVPAFSGSLRSVTPESVDRFRSDRLAVGLAPSTINVAVTVLSAILKAAVREKKLSRHPLTGFEKLKTNNERTRYLSPDEVARILAACDAVATPSRVPGVYLRAFITLALNLGARRNEILSLTRRTADLGARVAIFGKTKGGRPRIVPLNAAAIEAIRSLPLPVQSDAPLFPFRPLDMTRGFATVAARAGVTDVRLHDCRHTFASYQAMNGTPIRALQDLLGHQSGEMTRRYSHLSDAYLRAAVDRVQFGAEGQPVASELAPIWHQADLPAEILQLNQGDAPAQNRTGT